MKTRFRLALIMLVLGGCQTFPLLDGSGGSDHEAFMNLWNTFTHCRTGTDVNALQRDLRRLEEGATQLTAIKGFSLPLPERIERVIAHPAPRLAVDPHAMVLACALYTGQAALQARRLSLAAEMFRSVLGRESEGDYASYVRQARMGLSLVNSQVGEVPASQPPLRRPFPPVTEVSVTVPAGSGIRTP